MAIVAGNFKRISNNGAGPLYRSLILFISFLIISCGGAPSSSKLVDNSSAPAAQPTGKISADLLKKLDSNAITSTNGFKVAIKLKEGEDISDVISDSNVRYRASSLVNAVFVDLDRTSVLRLADDKRVEKIEENSNVKINLFYATKQTGARDVWTNYGVNGATFSGTANKIRLGVIDTGIDNNHLDFDGRIAKKVNCYQIPTCVENSGYKDDHGHGSHVAGIVLGSGASADAAGVDAAYIELHGTLNDVSTATRYFFPSQFQVTPSGNLSADMTWTSSIATNGSIGFQAKADAEALNNTFLFSYSQATSSGPSVAPGTFLSSGTWPVSDGVAGVQLMPHSFVASTTDTNAIGKEFWARIKTVAQGWGPGDTSPRMAGMSYGAELVAVKSLNASGSGGIDDIVRSLEYIGSIAEANNIIAVNLSFSIGNGVSSDVLKSAARGLVSKGVAVIVSAGNEQQDGFNISSPGDEPTVITVGAVNDQNQVTSYSSIGSLASSPLKPDVLAPGGSFITRNYIMSAKTTYIDSKWNRTGDPSITMDPYALKIGTSQAAPFVTGLIGLMASKGTTTWTFNSATLPLQYKMLICMTAFETGSRESSSIFFGAPITPERAGGIKDRVEGYGRIDARGALSAFDGGSLTDPFTFGPKIYEQKSFVRELSLSSDNEYNFTMAVPSGADYDLYLFSGTPDSSGEPVLLASSALVDNPTEWIIDFIPPVTGAYYLVAKWISGGGTASFATKSVRTKPAIPTQISNFRIDRFMSNKKITVSWTTNVPAISKIQYGSTGGMGSEQMGTDYTTNHSFTFDISFDNYYYVRGLSNSAGSTDLDISTAVTPVYRTSTFGTLEKDISIEDLPIVPNVGGCGMINDNKSGGNSGGLGAAILLLPLLVLVIIRKKKEMVANDKSI